MNFIDNLFTFDAATSTFLVIGGIGLAVLLISVFVDGIFNLFDFGDGPLSITTLSAFASVFGFSAVILFSGFGFDVQAAALLGLIPALAGGAGAWALSNFLKKSEHSDTVSTTSIVGSEGSITLAVPAAKDGYGEVTIRSGGNIYSFSAKADTKLPAGTRVVIDGVISNTLVTVSPVHPALSSTSEEASTVIENDGSSTEVFAENPTTNTKKEDK